MRRFAGSCRFVFNAAVALQKLRHEQGEKKLGYAGLCRQLTEWRHNADTAWLADAPVHPLQQALKDPVLRARYAEAGTVVAVMSPAQSDEYTAGAVRKYRELEKLAGGRQN